MSTLAEIEAAVPNLNAEELAELERFVQSERRKATAHRPAHRSLPLVPAIGVPITQQDIDDAADAE